MFVTKPSGVYYKIENAQNLPAFFINVATASDMWMFLSSNGALAAGRQNPAGSVFPYETDDRLHLATSTGPKTLIRMKDGRVWQPFSTGLESPYRIRRSLYKRNTGDAIIFEEVNDCLKLQFSYRWETGEKYGLVRTSQITNLDSVPVSLEVLDGVENIMPYDVAPVLAQGSSCLTDAYKACESIGSRLVVYSLTSLIGDTTEPIEVLRANIAWHISDAEGLLLSSNQVANFARGGIAAIKGETNSVGRKGAFLGYQSISLDSGAEKSWLLILDARLNQKEVAALAKEVNNTPADKLRAAVEADVKKGTAELKRIVAVADGLQHTKDGRSSIRHYMNVLYNNMRGGVFLDEYGCDPQLFIDFLKTHDKELAVREAPFLEKIKDIHNILQLHEAAFENGNPDLIRLALEFLPLTFSRRHGDPSRPWNHFHVRVKDDEGRRVYSYEGNWRDIFQNWEAMSLSFPGYIAPMIAKFLNASTADGFNPYRINQDGIDWETPLPHDPWAGYGYWGDHQIVYLNKLLEWLEAYSPEDLAKLVNNEIYAYANVPYEIKPYAELLKDGKSTITFNREKHDAIMKRVEFFGTDGKLLTDDKGGIYYVSFVEKLLVPILAKLSNLVPGGGIWMNTQRPEWNDANNAIVGNGLSMVTVYQLYRHLHHCKNLFEQRGGSFNISADVVEWLTGITDVLEKPGLSPRAFLDEAEGVFDKYRSTVYANGFANGKKAVDASLLAGFIDKAIAKISESIAANKRPDGMYNAYNILTLTEDSLKVDPMFLMLEGQTAVIGSGILTPEETLTLVKAMETGNLMSPEHNQFFLYPRKTLKTFMERNIIPEASVEAFPLIGQLIQQGHEGFFTKDIDGNVRFHDTIRHSADIERWIKELKLSDTDAAKAREIYEEVFAHKQFTGRSGIMYKYEGIGSIYWHQNSKFMLSVQEVFSKAAENDSSSLAELKEAYYRLRAGFGFNKEADKWGAFPLEPYSHTPFGMPAQQPGMTGMVKEDILTRMAELGVTVKDGVIKFDPALLRKEEFFTHPETFEYLAADGTAAEIQMPANSLGFTVCRVPVIYTLGNEDAVHVYPSGSDTPVQANCLQAAKEISSSLFKSDGSIQRIDVTINPSRLI
ncbi:MAG: hypothetical protein FWC32_03985 [Firmicutes bacterium]|nr:hypothetical protein [Bacillota bacterium]